MGTQSKLIDLTGATFGNLTVSHRVGKSKKKGAKTAIWRCLCTCGRQRDILGKYLRLGKIKACNIDGHRWRDPNRGAAPAMFRLTYASWRTMRRRCNDPKHNKYANYGARGITVCTRWEKSFDNFLKDMGPRPSKLHSIERNDVNGNYGPDNCKWATNAEQARNRTNTVMVTHEGREMKLIDLVTEFGLSRQHVYGRLASGWTLEQAITVPIKKYRKKGIDKPPTTY